MADTLEDPIPVSSDGRVAVYIDFDNIVISRYDEVHGRGDFQRDRQRKRTLKDLLGRKELRQAPDEFWAFRDVSFDVHAGESIGVVGRNGQGKSTLLRILAGALDPDSGRVTRRGGVVVGVLDQGDSLPAGTVNAIGLLARYLLANDLVDDASRAFVEL